MTDTTNHYECTKCGRACDLVSTRRLVGRAILVSQMSKCCRAEAKVASSKE